MPNALQTTIISNNIKLKLTKTYIAGGNRCSSLGRYK